jgi:putative heme-binding domain-containing protein
MSLRPAPAMPATTAMPKGPGRNYSVDEATTLVRGHLTGRDFSQGQAMFAATACAVCHRLGATGQGTAGPVLTQAASRYTERDLLESIINPSASVNENNASTLYEMNDGTTLVGQPAFEEHGELFVATNPMLPNDLTLVRIRDIKASRPYEKSVMPAGLINSLNENELRDLVAFILSGGNASHEMFARPNN